MFRAGFVVRAQKPLAFSDLCEPEPDLAVVSGTPRDYLESHPMTAVLVLEVAYASLIWDRSTKASVYARAGIPEYWIVNPRDRVLEVHREPAPMAEQSLGFSYRSVTRHTESETVTPVAAPRAAVKVAELLP